MSAFNWEEITAKINRLLRPKSTIIGLKFCETQAEIQDIPKVRFSDKKFTVCMMLGQSIYNGWTVGILRDNILLDYCKIINGLAPVDERFASGRMIEGVWQADLKSAQAHNAALNKPVKIWEAIVASPLASGRIKQPDVCLHYLSPGQVFVLMAGYLYDGHEKLNFDFVGESSCSDAWMRVITTGQPSVTIPCFAERKFAGVRDEEMSVALTPEQLLRAVDGMERLSNNGLRYPFAPYSIFNDVTDGFPADYLNY